MGNEIPQGSPIILVPETEPVRKRFRLNKWHVITVVLVAVIVVQGFMYVSLNSRYEALNADHKSLTAQNQTLESNNEILTGQYNTLLGQHDELTTDYNSLQSDYDSLQSTYSSLQSSYTFYVSSYDNLQNQLNFRTLPYSYGNIEDFITPTDAIVENRVFQVTGGWSNPSDWNEYWSDVRKLYDWVVNNIEYRSDGLFPVLPTTPSGYLEYDGEMWQFPSETLSLLQGDCEDMAILLTSMIRSYNGGEYWIECITIESSTSGHAGVQIPVEGDLVTILDPAGNYYTRDLYGNIDTKDISTEINNWLNYWKPEMGSDVHVDGVFSDNLHRSFSSTSEYTSWMYSR